MAKRGMNIFNSVKLPGVQSSRFSLAHDLKYSFSMGELVPTCAVECLPGDKFNINAANMLRFAPLIAPVMHNIRVTIDFYFVPNRLLWAGWEDWITGNDDAAPPRLTLSADVIPEGSIADYLGIPPGAYESMEISCLPVAAYYKIWDEYYRDQNLQNEQFLPLIAGDNDAYLGKFFQSPLFRAWQHDYFTAALPFAQKGPSVQLPLTQADNQVVEYQNNPGTADAGIIRKTDGTIATSGSLSAAAGPSPLVGSMRVGSDPAAYDPNGTLVVDVQGDAVDINTVRRAYALQRWLERNARAGTRYVESILAHFGVKSSDSRLQRPEFIGRNVQNMVISEVLSTAQTLEGTDVVNPVGEMAGHGISVGGGGNFNFFCEEHGWIIGIINVQPDTAYQDGLHKKFHRFDRLDYGWPTFANIGEQEVKQKEVYAFTPGDPDRTFGYVPRYAEYKFEQSRVAGNFRSNLAYWHLGRKFDGDVALNDEFVMCQPRTDIFAITDPTQDHIYAHTILDIKVSRKLPRYGTPTI